MKTNLKISISLIVLLMTFRLNSFASQDFFNSIQKMAATEENQLILESNQLSLDKNVTSLFVLINGLNKLDKYTKTFGDEIKEVVADGDVLNGYQINTLQHILNSYHSITTRLFEYAIFYAPENKEQLQEKFLTEGTEETKKQLIWLTVHAKLYGSFYDLHDQFYAIHKIRRILKNISITNADIEQQNKMAELTAIASHILLKKNRNIYKGYMTTYNVEEENFTRNNKKLKRIKSLIKTHVGIKNTLRKKRLHIKSFTFRDALLSFFGKVTNAISGFFGNFIGKISWRKGYFLENQEVINKLTSTLKPLDIIFDKSPFILTDAFIPGHFGHVAIYFGTEKQLKEIGMWNHPMITKYHKEIRAGKNIIEAIRPKTRLSSIEHFLNVDEIMVMRNKNVLADKENVAHILTVAFEQMGKKYDFNFDVETTDKIVCSELIFHSFGKINWPTEYIFGRQTITPDNVAELMFYENSPVSFNYNIFSVVENKLEERSLRDFSKKLDYVVNDETSTEEKLQFDKKIRSCKTVVKKQRFGPRHRRGAPRRRRICTNKRKHYTYQEYSESK